jgi:DNA-binding MarR family transcriptional regulator
MGAMPIPLGWWLDLMRMLIICTLMISTHRSSAGDGEDREQSIGYLVHEVARLFRRRFEDEARVHGVTLPQWRAMIEILRNEEITQVGLASCIDTDPMTISGILDRLEKRGLIERYADPHDSRAKRARMTKAGLELVETARNVGRGMYEQAMAGVGESERTVAIHALRRIRDNLSGSNAEQKELQE